MNEISGLPALTAALARVGVEGLPAMAAALYVEAEKIMAVSKERVPVDTGVLRASGHVELPHVSGTGVEVDFGYGGAAERYAWIQHERMDYQHSHGGPKYLEGPCLEAVSGMEVRVAARVAAKLK